MATYNATIRSQLIGGADNTASMSNEASGLLAQSLSLVNAWSIVLTTLITLVLYDQSKCRAATMRQGISVLSTILCANTNV